MILSVHVPPLKQELWAYIKFKFLSFIVIYSCYRHVRISRLIEYNMRHDSNTHTHTPFSAIRDVGFTVNASKARPTGAGVGVNVICACASIFAG